MKSVGTIKPPSKADPGTHCLFVYRGAGPSAFMVDSFAPVFTPDGGLYRFEGKVGDDLIVAFPANVPYLLIKREFAKFITPKQMKAWMEKEEKEWGVSSHAGHDHDHHADEGSSGYRPGSYV